MIKTNEISDTNKIISKVHTILTDSNPILHQISKDVDDYTTIDIQQLIQDMISTMYHANGIGLAAPQIGRLLRIIVFYLPAHRDDVNNQGIELTVLINPIIKVLNEDDNNDQMILDYEGCLSVPGFRGKVLRYKSIEYSGINEKGETIRRVARGWHARLVQHEVDHLNGIIYTDKLLDIEGNNLLTIEEWKALTAK